MQRAACCSKLGRKARRDHGGASDASCCGASFETPRKSAAPPATAKPLRGDEVLMVRSAATPRVSNHGANGNVSEIILSELQIAIIYLRRLRMRGDDDCGCVVGGES